MNPAFVSGAAPSALSSSFAGASLKSATACSRPAVSMAAQGPVSRRQALQAGAALLAALPLAALAKSGDSPKQSIFGVGGASSPFTAGIATGGKVQYSQFGDDEVARFKRIVAESRERIAAADQSIKTKSWEDLRSRLRLEASEVRQVLRQYETSLDGDVKKAATKASSSFKTALEDFDQACIQKSPAKASKAYTATVKSLTAWETAVGF